VRQDGDDRVAVGLEQRLGDLDPLRPAVALDLALVGVELEAVEPSVAEPRSSRLMSGAKARRGAPGLAAQAQVRTGVGVVQENQRSTRPERAPRRREARPDR
jgi:hypothetical protein